MSSSRRGEISDPRICGLDAVIAGARERGHIDFTASAVRTVAHAALQFVTVGAPPAKDGSADLQHVLAGARMIGEHGTERRIVATKPPSR